jgi:hypothetical protein
MEGRAGAGNIQLDGAYGWYHDDVYLMADGPMEASYFRQDKILRLSGRPRRKAADLTEAENWLRRFNKAREVGTRRREKARKASL